VRLGALAAAACALVLAAGCGGSSGGSDGGSSGPLPPPAPPVHTTKASDIVKPWVTTSGGKFVDQNGQQVVLRGFDMSVGMAFLAPTAQRMGANMARVYVGWDAIEPQAPKDGHYRWDAKTLGKLDRIVAALRAVNINVLIDFHQFHWSPYFAKGTCSDGKVVCRGSGVPAWYYANGRFPDNHSGRSHAEAAFWTTEASRSQAYYKAFVTMIAERYASAPNVIGYELFNEPHGGKLGDTTEATNTMLRWQAPIRSAIQKVDPTRTVFIMCRGGGEGVGTADLKPFGSLDHMALDWHDYFNGGSGGLDSAGDNWVPSWADTHNQETPAYTGSEAAQARVLQVPLERARSWGIPLLVGEWGIHTGSPGAEEYQRQMLDLFAKDDVSWTRWLLATGGGFALLNNDDTLTPEASQLAATMRATSTTP
jgi:endoglycosylceramidase